MSVEEEIDAVSGADVEEFAAVAQAAQRFARRFEDAKNVVMQGDDFETPRDFRVFERALQVGELGVSDASCGNEPGRGMCGAESDACDVS